MQTVSTLWHIAGICVLFACFELAASTLVSLSSNIDKHPPWHRFFVLFTIMIFVVDQLVESEQPRRACCGIYASEKNSLSEESSAPSEPLLSGTNDESPVHNIDSTERQSTWSSCRNDVYERMIGVPRLMVSSPFLCCSCL